MIGKDGIIWEKIFMTSVILAVASEDGRKPRKHMTKYFVSPELKPGTLAVSGQAQRATFLPELQYRRQNIEEKRGPNTSLNINQRCFIRLYYYYYYYYYYY
jgi:hypothetical protein